MNPSEWIALGLALLTLIGLVSAMVLHALKYAYDKGVTDHRIHSVEEATRGLPAAFSALTAGVVAMQHTTERVDKALERLENRVFRSEP